MNFKATSQELADNLISWIRQYAAMNIDSYQIDGQDCLPPQLISDLGAKGFFGMHISKKYGGLELKTSDMLRVIEQIAAIDLTLTTMIIETIQGSHTLERYATKKIKDQYLNKLAQGHILMAGAMTESVAGSNPRAMESTITPHVNGYLLNGSKRWVGMGDQADIIAFYAHQYDSNNNWLGMSGFLIPKGSVGLQIGPGSKTMGLRGFSKNSITFNNIQISADNLLGEIGNGMEIAQDNMMYIRLCLSAASIGAMKRCAQLVYRYAKRRSIATGRLIENPVTLTRLSEMTVIIEAIDNFVYVVSKFYDDNSVNVPEEAFIVAKILGSEYLGRMTDLLVQTLGARGYEEASGISKIFRDARVFRIFEGPTEALNMYLGSKMSTENTDFETLVSQMLQQPKLFAEMKQDIERVNHYCSYKKQELFEQPFSTKYWAQALIGEIITYGLLLACVEFGFKENKSNFPNVKLWARTKYNEAVETALSFSLQEKVLLETSRMREIISNYTYKIGNVDQQRTSKDVFIDPLLMSEKSDLFLEPVLVSETSINNISTNVKLLNKEMNENTDEPCLFVHELFESQVILNPKATAVVFYDQKITYEELNEKSNKLANYLINKGIKNNQLIGVYIERSIEMIIGVLGILKAGCAYLPLDVSYPTKSLQFMIEDSGADIVLTKDKSNCIPFLTKQIVCIDDVLKNTESQSFEKNIKVNITLDSENLCYVIYTSGSTGTPKGVMLPHKSLTNLIKWHKNKIKGKRNVLQFTTLNFDVSFLEIFSALGTGGALILISEHDRRDLINFSQIVEKYHVEQLALPVPFLKSLVGANLEKKYFENVKEIIIAGEQLIVTPAIKSFFKQLSCCQLLNYYGPSESHAATSYTFPKDVDNWPEYPPIGKCIQNAKILLLDENQQPVAHGEIGEIYIGGICLAKGYLNRNKLTNEKFIKDPWGKSIEERLYRSGDFAKYLPDGNLVFLGRKDDQIKIRGYRIELQEIELNLGKHPRVKEAVVIAKKDGFMDQHLEAYIVVSGSYDKNLVHEIRSFLKSRIPDQLIPWQIRILEQLPLTSTGKIDRFALATDEKYSNFSNDNIMAPKTKTEEVIIDIMEDIYKIRIGTNYSFASIGGNSLLAMHIISKIKTKLCVNIPVHSLLSDPTIAHTAKRIDLLISNNNMKEVV